MYWRKKIRSLIPRPVQMTSSKPLSFWVCFSSIGQRILLDLFEKQDDKTVHFQLPITVSQPFIPYHHLSESLSTDGSLIYSLPNWLWNQWRFRAWLCASSHMTVRISKSSNLQNGPFTSFHFRRFVKINLFVKQSLCRAGNTKLWKSNEHHYYYCP